jgi:hypothetical protein
MKAKFLKFVQWWDTPYGEGEVHDLDPVIFARLLRAGSIEPYKEQVKEIEKVEQPEKPSEAVKPVATKIKPLPTKKKGKKK